jgi:hypothetical protein
MAPSFNLRPSSIMSASLMVMPSFISALMTTWRTLT